MKLKVVLAIVEKILGMSDDTDAPRADMYLPDRLLAMSLILLSGGIVCTIIAFIISAIWAVVCAVLGFGLGIAAYLCWRNQTIHVISDSQFTYTTMFGNTHTYSFSDIQGLRRNQDSLTLYVSDKNVHIESMAILSERLIDCINQSLQKLN